MKLSEIFKRTQTAPPTLGSQPPAAPPVSPPTPPAEVRPTQPPPKPLINPSTLYQQLVDLMAELFERLAAEQPIDQQRLVDAARQLVESVEQDETAWLGLAYRRYEPQQFLAYHCLNVAILCLTLGKALRLHRRVLEPLALAALLHDVGMIKVLELALLPRRITPQEHLQIQAHVTHTVELFERYLPQLAQQLIPVISGEHERINGEGYPKRLKDGEFEEVARLLAAVDVYEAMTHPRSWRERIDAPQVITEMITSMKAQFDPVMLKHLISRLGFYPVGSWVSLSNGEVGRVIKCNPETPLRPVLEITTDARGAKLPEPKHLDLSQHPTLGIKEFLGNDEPPR